ncbi:MAG: DNA methyltransferase [Lacipirellulaceae bacterium]
MPLSWNEIRSRAIAFSREWAEESREHAEAKSFWDGFFDVFGIKRKTVASFEAPVKQLGGGHGFIDLFWKGVLIAEHKSRGKDLGKAHAQAMDYAQSLQREGRGDEAPRYLIVSDFARVALHDLEEGTTVEVALAELHQSVQHFAFIPGYKTHKLAPEDPVNLRAVQIMGDLHDALEADGFTGHGLERFLVRVLFCLFAEDTGIFDRDAFTLYVVNHTKEDGKDLGAQLSVLFQALNTPREKRQKSLLEELVALPYVNGELFGETLPIPSFNRSTRNALVACTRFDWGRISPAVFGALFQGVMEPRERRQVGAHYTSERDILKLIGPLFLDGLKADLEKAGTDKRKLTTLHDRLARIKLLDPACGCGNFLVVSYRELRLLELEVLERLAKKERQKVLDVSLLMRLDVDQMHGVEIEEWPARIAEVAMWLMDHQMNQLVSERFGQYVVRLPLKKSPKIAHGNALRLDWNTVLPAAECSHVLGNPPFVGAKYQCDRQRAEVTEVFAGVPSAGLLDYVACWYYLAARYLHRTTATVGFVSTNSITQGEQVGVLWPAMNALGVSIHFAHRTFAWQSEARGAAHVHVVIVGFGLFPATQPLLFDYETLKGEPAETPVQAISPYLLEGSFVVVVNRSKPLCAVPPIGIGNKPIDGGNYLFTDEEKESFVRDEPNSAAYFRRWYGSREYINRAPRWCLWLGECAPNVLRAMPKALARVEAVKRFRLASDSAPTQKIADKPTRFHVENLPSGPYLLVPKVSSERRGYIPMGFLGPDVLCSDLVFIVPDANQYHFGVLSSAIHMAWVRYVAGRLKSDYRYSATLVYNNYPWPLGVTDAQRTKVEAAAQAVLDAREAYPDATLADLYDPLSMPANLKKAHDKLDLAVDKCYRAKAFATERERVEHLFKLYQELTTPLLSTAKPKSSRSKRP